MDEVEDRIAVVGIGCNFPGGEGLDNFWKVLVNGKNCSVPIPKERFDIASWYDPDDNKAGKSRTAKAALIEGFNEFDHRFFGISDGEVERMDPQQKMVLQCVYRALEDAGLPMEKASGTKTGVFLGFMNREYESTAGHVHAREINHWTGTGLAMSIAANRVSYVFNLTGPSMAIDSACSSSLVALHLACQAIKQGDCEMALCGGVNLVLEPNVLVALSKAKMISPDGTCKPFSSTADGYGRGEGCGFVLLKPLRKALKENDHIWGVITKTAVNQDGHTVSPITKPSMVQQEELLRTIYSESDLQNVQYIEAHGTGTPVGDPTEAGSISNVIAKARHPDSETLRIGSVKSNIGHTESAAGVAGLIKVLLMMKHETIVPTLFYSEHSASIDAKALNIKIPTEVEMWNFSGERIAGVNNFGFGGTNAHVIVKQHKQTSFPQTSTWKQNTYLVMSANSPNSLISTMEDTIKQVDADSTVDLDSLVYTSACRRSHLKHKYRKAIVISSLAELKGQVKSALSKNITPSFSDVKLVFVFCGNGVTYHGMCKQLLKQETVFREKVKEIEQLFQRFSRLSLLDRLESEFESSDFSSPDVIQPLLFAIQVGIATLLKYWGVKPDAILGHSVGEVAAAHCSGLLSLEDAVKVIYHRSSLQSKVTGGKMLVISNMAVSEVLNVIPRYSNKVCLAAVNSPQSCTLSGDADAIESLYSELHASDSSQNLFLRVLNVPAAYHSHMMDTILSDITHSIGSLQVNDLESELISTVTGKEVTQHDFSTGMYWARNVREPVLFEQAVRAASKGKRNAVFVEIGPRRALQRNIMETLGNNTPVLGSVLPDKDHETMLSLVSKLFELGVTVDWSQFYRGCETSPLPFPRYQFDSSKRDVVVEMARRSTTTDHPVLRQTGKDSNTFSCDLLSDSSSYLQEHKYNGTPIVPGAFYIELGLAAFMANTRPKIPLSSLQLSVNFQSPFELMQNTPEMKVQLVPAGNDSTFKVFSSSRIYASGTIACKQERVIEEKSIALNSIYKRCKSVVSFKELYLYLSRAGFQHGNVFQNKGDVYYGEDLMEAYSVVTVPEDLRPQLHDYCIHPVVFDFLMQLLPVTIAYNFTGRPGFPVKIGRVTVLEPLQHEMIIYIRATDLGVDHFEVCGFFTDLEGRVLVEVKHVLVKYLGSHTHVVEEYFYHNEYNVVSENITSPDLPKALVFSDRLGIAKAMQQHLDSRSRFISFSHAKEILSHGFHTLLVNLNITDVGKYFDEVLFLWGKEDLSSVLADNVLKNLVSCCEIFRRIVVELKLMKFPNSIRAITYRAAENTVDHISPGFALFGMTRALAAEIPELSFQLIDISSISTKDITALSQILRSYPCSKYPELVVKDGSVLKPSIVRTPIKSDINSSDGNFCSTVSDPCILQTADAYTMTKLSAVPFNHNDRQPVAESSVEIQISKMCAHTSDYYPVSISNMKYGQTIYYNKQASQNHNLLALDFSGTITAVGKDVRKFKVGDHVVACYPVQAGTTVSVPVDACYGSKRFPFLRRTPCVSYFVLAWEILRRALSGKKQNLGIISSVPDSVLMKVLTLTAHKSGWNVIGSTQCNGSFVDRNQVEAFVLLPQFDESMIANLCNVPGVRNVIVVCESQSQCLVAQDTFQNVREGVRLQIIQMPVVLQKGSLTAQKSHVYHWLKSMNLDGKSFTLENVTLQRVTSESIENHQLEISKSYFNLKTLPVVALAKDVKGALSVIPLLPTKKQLFRKQAVYIVTGGLTGLGFETVRFICQRGGGHVVILSRSSPSTEMKQEIQNVEKQCGASIIAMGCDVSVSENVCKTIGTIGQKFLTCPIRGVFHSAVVLHDGLIETLNKSLYEKVLKPKVNGVLNLHHATQHCELDYFVCYSSISSFLGNAAQVNYAAANSFLDTFCHYRRKLGLPGQSINWGALNLGLLLNKEHFHKFLEAKGIMVLDVTDIHASLEQCLVINRPQQAVCRFNFKNIRYSVLSQNAALSMRLSSLVEETHQKSKQLDSQTKQADSVTPSDYVKSLLSETVGIDKSELSEELLLSSLGVDSMQAMTLQNLIFQDRGVNVPLVKLLNPNATMSTLVTIVTEGTSSEHMNDDQGSTLIQEIDDFSTRL